MNIDEQKLDNPVYHSLLETHQNFAIVSNGVRFYHPDYCPFGGFIDANTITESSEKYANLVDNFYVVGEEPPYSKEITIAKNLVCHQMLLNNAVDVEIKEQIVKLESYNNKEDLLSLVNLVQPGYFKSKTSQLGNYFGIYKDDKLVAVTGERMKMHSYTEISAVVTHPEHTGKGYAKQLTAVTANSILSEGKIPYLHVAVTNIGAIALYEKLGFTFRREISFWNCIKR